MIYSKNNFGSWWPLLAAVLALIFLAVLQIAVFNSLFNINLILTSILILILAQYNKSALLFAWILGFLTDVASFSVFGVNSAVFLITAIILIIINKTTLFTLKTENIISMSFLAVFLYHLADWLVLNGLALINHGSFENLSFFANWNFITGLITTTVLTLIIVKYFRTFFGNE